MNTLNHIKLHAFAALVVAALVLGAGFTLAHEAVRPLEDAKEQPVEYDARRFVRHQTGTETCLVCHGSYNPVVKTEDEPRKSLWLDAGMFYQSVHAKKGCQSCHTNIDVFGHRMAGVDAMPQRCGPCHAESDVPEEDDTGSVERHEAFVHMLETTGFSEVLVTTLQACHDCHLDEFHEYAQTIHGVTALADPSADTPTCVDCHGSHDILVATDERSRTNPANIPATCLVCHDQAEIKARAGLERNIKESFRESFHGSRSELGGQAVAVCSNCHGSHDIYAPSDPRSRVNQIRIAKTCGECHEGAQLNFASAFTHKVVSPSEQLGLYILKQIYKWVIFLLIAQFVVFAALDIYQNLRRRIKSGKGESHV